MDLRKLFSMGVSELVDSIGNTADKIFTSKEEKLQLKNELVEIQGRVSDKYEEALAQYEKEITSRHSSDMASDSWLSKNIRPLTLAFLMITTMGLAYGTIFGGLPDKQVDMLKAWIPLLITLDTAAVTFYFGSRGMEKIKTSIPVDK
jgi:hypothetical protein